MKNEILVLVAFLLLLIPAFAQSPPILYRGYVLLSGSVAVDGTIVSVEVNGIEVATATIPLQYTSGSGRYELQIPADHANLNATFKINGVNTINPAPGYTLGSPLDSPITLNLALTDTQAPTHNYTIVSPASVANNSDITITTKFDDALSGVSSVSRTIKNSAGTVVNSSTALTQSGSVWSITDNIVNLDEGTYLVVLTATDNVGNAVSMNTANFTVVSASSGAEGSSTNTSVTLNSSITNSFSFVTTSNTTVGLDMTTSSNVTGGTISVSEYSTASNTTSVGIPALNKYVEITVSPDITSAMTATTIKVYYTDAEIMAAGLDESTLRLYFYNSTSGTWQKYDTPNGGVDTTNNYVWAITNHFSTWGIFGNLVPTVTTTTTTTGGGGGGGGCTATYTLTAPTKIDATSSPATIPVTVKNTGTCSGTVTVTTTVPSGWTANDATTKILGAGQSDTVNIIVTYPASATTGVIAITGTVSGKTYTATTEVKVPVTATQPEQPAPAPLQGETLPAPQPLVSEEIAEQTEAAPTTQTSPITGFAAAAGNAVTGYATFVADNPIPSAGVSIVVILGCVYVGYKQVKNRGKRGKPRELKASRKIETHDE